MEVNGRMKVEYKKEMNQIHAPEYLMRSTIHRIEQEKFKHKHTKKKILILSMTTAAAVFLLLFIATQSSTKLIYNDVQLNVIRVEQSINKEETISLKEYETYIGEDLSFLLGEIQSYKKSITVTYTGTNITSDQSAFYYDVDGEHFIIKLSKTKEIADKKLLQGKASDVDGIEVILGKDRITGTLLAAGKIKNIHFYISATGSNEEHFERNLKTFIKNFVKDETK